MPMKKHARSAMHHSGRLLAQTIGEKKRENKKKRRVRECAGATEIEGRAHGITEIFVQRRKKRQPTGDVGARVSGGSRRLVDEEVSQALRTDLSLLANRAVGHVHIGLALHQGDRKGNT